MAKVIIKLEDFRRVFNDKTVMQDINLEVHEGEFFTFLGSSGCGKTTILRSISGLDRPTSGKVYIDGEDVTNLEPQKRKVNTIFQNYALFPLMTVYDNIAFGLKMKKIPKDEIKTRVEKMLDLVHLTGYDARYPKDLSGGEQQRVAIARGLINNPKVLLLDEPLSALDAKLRKEMQLDLKRLQKRLGITFIYVTHDQDEALTMSDRICLLHDGSIAQLDTPINIYENPSDLYVANFLGEANVFDSVIKDNVVMIEDYAVKVKDHNLEDNSKVKVIIRPENIIISKSQKDNCLKGVIKEMIYDGSTIKINVKTENNKVKALILSKDNTYSVGEEVFLTWKLEDTIVLSK